MRRGARIWIRRIIRIVVYGVLLVVACAALAFAFVQTGPGRRMAANAVTKRLSRIPYLHADIQGVGGLLPFHVKVDAFALRDEKGLWLEAKGVSAHLSVRNLFRGRVLVPDASADELHILRSPHTGANKAADRSVESKGALETPPVLFSSITIDRLVLDPELTGVLIDCSLTGHGTIGDEPGVIVAHADVTGLLEGDGPVDVRIDLGADVTAIEAEAGLTQLAWDDLLVGDVNGSLTLTLPEGGIEMRAAGGGRWEDIPVVATAECAYAEASLAVHSLAIHAPFGEATGRGALDLPSRRVVGTVEVSVPDLATVPPMVGLDLRGQASARLELIERDGSQALRGSIRGSQARGPWGTVEIFDGSLDIADLSATRDMTFAFHGQGLERDALRIRDAELSGSVGRWDRAESNDVYDARAMLVANGLEYGETTIHDLQFAGQFDHIALANLPMSSGVSASGTVNAVTHGEIRLDVLHAAAATDDAAVRIEADAEGWVLTNVTGRLTASVAQDARGWKAEVSSLHAEYGQHVAQLENAAVGGLSGDRFFVTNVAVRIDDALLEATGQWQSNRFDVVTRTQDLNTHAIPFAALADTDGTLSAVLSLSGTLKDPVGELHAELKGLRFAERDMQDRPAMNLTWDASMGDGELSAFLEGAFEDGGQFRASATLPAHFSFMPPGVMWMTNDPIAVAVTTELELSTLNRLPLLSDEHVGGRILADLEGTLTADLALSGSLRDPAGELHGELKALRSVRKDMQRLPAVSLRWNAVLRDGDLSASLEGSSEDGGRLQAGAVFPAHISLLPPGVSWMTNDTILATVTAELDLAALNRLPLLSEQRLGGQISADLRYEGTAAKGNATGYCRIKNGTYENFTLGTMLREIEVELVGHNEALELRNASASDGGAGRIQAGGSLDLTPKDGFTLDLAATMDRLRLARLDAFTATTSGSLSLTGSVTRMHVDGNITIDDALLDLNLLPPPPPPKLVDFDRSAGAATNAVEETATGSPSAVAVRIKIAIPPQFRVRGPGLDSTWEGELLYVLGESGPRLTGRVEPRRGTFSFIGRQFDLRDGEIDVGGAWPPVPVLNLRATHRRPDITAILYIRGRAAEPRFELTSEPPYPPGEVLSQVLFGKGAGAITGLQAIELASAMNNMRSGRADEGLFERAKAALSVDQLGMAEQGAGGTGQATLVVGKHVSDRVYVEVNQGFNREGTIVTVEYEIRRNLTIETDTGNARLNPGIGVNWKRDY